jgi:hypothetical protein
MGKALTMCAISIWLSTTVVEKANAAGTFRLSGPWTSSSPQRKATENVHRCSHQQMHRALNKHSHQVCFRELESRSSRV